MKRFFDTTLNPTRIESHTAAGEWSNLDLSDQIAHWALRRPDDIVIIDRFGPITWSQLVSDVDAVSCGLLELGVRPGEVVQVQLPNWHHFVVSVVAIERIGAVVNPVAPIFRHKEVAVMSELARPTLVITAAEFHGFELGAMHAQLRESCDWVSELVVVAGTDSFTGTPDSPVSTHSNSLTSTHSNSLTSTHSWDELLEHGHFSAYDKATLDLLRPAPHDVCEVIFTSGTTGVPKGVMHCPNTLNAAAELIMAQVCDGVPSPWGDNQAPDAVVMHMASTLAHQTGYIYGARMPLLAGGRMVLQDVWDPVEFMTLVDEHKVDMSMGATPFLADVLDSPELANHDLSSWSRFICGGAAIPKPLLERSVHLLPSCTVLPVWGMTECAVLTAGLPTDPLEKRLTDGVALPGNEVRVVDASGTVVTDVVGDLQCRGSLLFLGYIQGRALTEECYSPATEADAAENPGAVQHWFHTGDRAIMDSDGYITIAGRTKDIIIRGGENVPVKEVEDVLIGHRSVANVALVGKPDDRLGEIGCAFVIVDGATPPTLSDLTDLLREQQMTPQFWPEDLIIVDEFPMTPSGKVQKYVLRDQLS